jgi:exonuclease SbcD
MVKILHFADAHIDMANYGRHDPESGLPMRVVDFLRSLDAIIDAAIDHHVDLVIFAGDAYKDRSPAPTFQREWGKRIMRLVNAQIPAILLVGNHDLSPSIGRAHALEEFKTLEVAGMHVADEPRLYTPAQLGVDAQVIAIPWLSRSGMIASMDIKPGDPAHIYAQLETKLTEIIDEWLAETDPAIPTILTAHASVQGAVYGGERTVMLGGDLVLSGSLVKRKGIDYTALGHIHKPQNLGGGPRPEDGTGTVDTRKQGPPVIYPGSIERVDFGEEHDRKYYVIAEVEAGAATVTWHELTGIRAFISVYHTIADDRQVLAGILKALPARKRIADAVLRLTLEYPRDWEGLIDEAALREAAAGAFEFHLIKRPQIESRIRLPEDQAIGSMTPAQLLEHYWKSAHLDAAEMHALHKLAAEVVEGAGQGE